MVRGTAVIVPHVFGQKRGFTMNIFVLVILLVMLCSGAVMAATTDDSVTVALNALLPLILPLLGTFLIGLLMKSPLGKKLPKPVADFLTDLDPEELDYFVRLAITSTGRKEIAISAIMNKLRDISKRNGLTVDEILLRKWAVSILDHLIMYGKAGVKFATSKIKR